MKTIYILFVALSIFLLCSFFWRSSSPKVAYIDNARLFNEFELKKDLESELVKAENKRKFTIDSLKLRYSEWIQYYDSISARTGIDKTLLSQTREFETYIRSKEQEFEQEQALQLKQADEKIWKRLNQYVQNYSQENDYDLVFGVSGSGNIMYGKKHMDKTAEVIQYANNKYRGKK